MYTSIKELSHAGNLVSGPMAIDVRGARARSHRRSRFNRGMSFHYRISPRDCTGPRESGPFAFY